MKAKVQDPCISYRNLWGFLWKYELTTADFTNNERVNHFGDRVDWRKL